MLIQAVQAWNAPGINKQMTNFDQNEPKWATLRATEVLSFHPCDSTLLKGLPPELDMDALSRDVLFFFFYLPNSSSKSALSAGFVVLKHWHLWWWLYAGNAAGMHAKVRGEGKKLALDVMKIMEGFCQLTETLTCCFTLRSSQSRKYSLQAFEPLLTAIIPEVKTASCLGQFSDANGKWYLSPSLVLGNSNLGGLQTTKISWG